jgi:hypothetical protein
LPAKHEGLAKLLNDVLRIDELTDSTKCASLKSTQKLDYFLLYLFTQASTYPFDSLTSNPKLGTHPTRVSEEASLSTTAEAPGFRRVLKKKEAPVKKASSTE